ncbi:MAG: TlpA family protein disulfide reductase [Gemmatimonadetes bacterium]|nr:TlpA family protein disulfide reductase [Gemmatimonadota bacterium]
MRRRPRPRRLRDVLLLTVASVGAAACAGGPPAPAAPVAGVRPDPGWTLRTLDGDTFTLGELRGRPIFVNLWATWCPPCVAELGSIERLAENIGPSVSFVLASPEDPRVVREFVRRHGLAVSPVVEETLAPEAFGASALPHTVILDAEGRLVLRHRGAADWDTAEVRALLEALARTDAR